MKKLFMFVVVLAVFTATLTLNIGSASARALNGSVPVVVLRSPYFGHLDEGTHVPATIQGMSISCYTVSNSRLRCVVPDTFIGQYVTIKVKVDGMFLNFYVYVPDVTRIIWQ